jgi:HlyD family secretion protein
MSLASLRKINIKYWLLSGLVLLGAIAFFIWTNQSLFTSTAKYQTAAAKRSSLTSSIGATGIVRAAQSATLLWKTGGKVAAVNANINDKVSADQLLASLAPDSLSQNIILAQADLLTSQQNLDTLQQSNSSTATAMQNLSQANQKVKDAQDAYDSLTRTRVPDQVIKNTLDQLNKAQDQLKRIEGIYNYFLGYSHMAEGRPAKAQLTINITNIKQNIANLTAQYNWYTSKASAIDILKAQAALNVAIAAQEDAQRAMDRVKNGTNPDDVTAAKAKVFGAQATVNLSKIIAPFNGTLTKSQVQVGDRVSAGQIAFRMDDLTKLMVDMQISEVDINNVTIGQPVTITFDAIPNKIYNGVVSKVNLAAKAEKTGVNFGVTVTITDADELVKPGMSAAVTITVKQVGDALLVPNLAIRMLNGQRVVYILKNDLPVQVNIRLGATADNNSQVVGGDLKEGDLIILNPPVASNTVSATPVPTP